MKFSRFFYKIHKGRRRKCGDLWGNAAKIQILPLAFSALSQVQ